MWFGVVCAFIDGECALLRWSKFVVDSLGRASGVPNTLTTVMACSLSMGVQTALNHISICFLPQSQRHFVFSERELKKALRDTLTRAAWYGLLSTTAN